MNPLTTPIVKEPEVETIQKEIRLGRHVTLVGLWSNLLLAVLKILAGFFGRSSAMIADGVHSASDLLTDLLVLIVVSFSRKGEDARHTFGYGKIEALGTFVISLILGIVALMIAAEGVKGIIDTLNGKVIPRPEWIALVMAIISIGVKEILFHYTRAAARKIGSSAMEANAWHHRSDAFSSVATLIGIAGAMFLGVKWRVLDPIAAILVSIIIVAMTWRLTVDSIKELLDMSLPRDVIAKATQIINETPGVTGFTQLRTRRNGSRKIFGLNIQVDPGLNIVKAHNIATELEKRLRETFGLETLVYIHIEPLANPE